MRKSQQKRLVANLDAVMDRALLTYLIIKISAMNTDVIQKENNEAQCCQDYCQMTYNVADQQVVNNYKCNQQRFSYSDLWSIRRKARQFSIRTNL
jgi:hypothetical protein